MLDFGNARLWCRGLLNEQLRPGALAVDATMGNGHDTLFLAQLVGPLGHVWAFDVQECALTNTLARLEAEKVQDRVTLFLDSHARMAEHVPQAVDAVVFNLGWLPGQEHAVTTRAETTVEALNAAHSLLKPGGLITICVYPGHPEGMRELEAVTDWCRGLSDRQYDAVSRGYENISARPPRLFAIVKKQ